MGVQGPSESVDDAAAVCVLRRFTALFTAHDTRLPVGSAAGCGPCFRSHELLGRWGAMVAADRSVEIAQSYVVPAFERGA